MIIASYHHKYQMPNMSANHSLLALLLLCLLEEKLRPLAQSEVLQVSCEPILPSHFMA